MSLPSGTARTTPSRSTTPTRGPSGCASSRRSIRPSPHSPQPADPAYSLTHCVGRRAEPCCVRDCVGYFASRASRQSWRAECAALSALSQVPASVLWLMRYPSAGETNLKVRTRAHAHTHSLSLSQATRGAGARRLRRRAQLCGVARRRTRRKPASARRGSSSSRASRSGGWVGTPTTPHRKCPALMPLPASLRARPAPPPWLGGGGRPRRGAHGESARRRGARASESSRRHARPQHSMRHGARRTTQIHTVARGMARRGGERMRA
jgi:hypothetical protein